MIFFNKLIYKAIPSSISLTKIYSLAEKIEILQNIVVNRLPSAIEVGSIVSPKILPQMEQSIELFHEAECINIILPRPIDLYMLTPNVKSINIACDNNVKNFSFITSVSNDFQKKNTNKNLVKKVYNLTRFCWS